MQHSEEDKTRRERVKRRTEKRRRKEEEKIRDVGDRQTNPIGKI